MSGCSLNVSDHSYVVFVFGTCESSQFDRASHVVVKEDSSSFVVALDDCIQSLRTDAVACCSGKKEEEKKSQTSCFLT